MLDHRALVELFLAQFYLNSREFDYEKAFDLFHKAIQDGLSAENKDLSTEKESAFHMPVVPTFYTMPKNLRNGEKVLIIYLKSTQIRISEAFFEDYDFHLNHLANLLSQSGHFNSTGEEFYSYLAGRLKDFLSGVKHIVLLLSQPLRYTPDHDAKVLFDPEDKLCLALGEKNLVASLKKAIIKKFPDFQDKTLNIKVINEALACLLAGAYKSNSREHAACVAIGLGENFYAAYPEDHLRIISLFGQIPLFGTMPLALEPGKLPFNPASAKVFLDKNKNIDQFLNFKEDESFFHSQHTLLLEDFLCGKKRGQFCLALLHQAIMAQRKKDSELYADAKDSKSTGQDPTDENCSELLKDRLYVESCAEKKANMPLAKPLFSNAFIENFSAVKNIRAEDLDLFLLYPHGVNLLSSLCATDCDRDSLFYLIDAIMERSAQWTASLLLAIQKQLGKGSNPTRPLAVLLDGESFDYSPTLSDKLRYYIRIYGNEKEGLYSEIMHLQDSKWIGATLASIMQ